MTEIANPLTAPQRLRALALANDVRRARSILKRRVAGGELDAARVVVACPREAAGMRLADLLVCQRGWGQTRSRDFLDRLSLPEHKPIGSLTERQRRVVAALLATRAAETPTVSFPRPARSRTA